MPIVNAPATKRVFLFFLFDSSFFTILTFLEKRNTLTKNNVKIINSFFNKKYITIRKINLVNFIGKIKNQRFTL